MWIGSCSRRIPGATSVISVVAGSASCRGMSRTVLDPAVKSPIRAWREELLPVVPQLLDALEDVTERAVRADLRRRACEDLGVPPACQFLDRRHVDRPVVEVLFDLGEVGGEEATIGPDRVAGQRHGARFGDVTADELERA